MCNFIIGISYISADSFSNEFSGSSDQVIFYIKNSLWRSRVFVLKKCWRIYKKALYLTQFCSLIVKRCGSGYKGGSVAQLERICSPEMTFLSPSISRNLTALISFPGSGNTWVRHLLEEVTGVYTGSIYCDKVLKKSGFLGEKEINIWNYLYSTTSLVRTRLIRYSG